MPQFDITTFSSQIFWLGICFFFLCTIMVWHLAPRLTRALEVREHRVQEDGERAKNLIHELESLKRENQIRVREAQGKAHNLIRHAIEEAYTTKSTRLKVLDDELAAKMKETRDRLAEDQRAIRDHMGIMVSQVVSETALRILGQGISQSQASAIVQNILEREKS